MIKENLTYFAAYKTLYFITPTRKKNLILKIKLEIYKLHWFNYPGNIRMNIYGIFYQYISC